MFDTIHIGMSGLQAFSQGLKVIGNNVANLNTPGFKTSNLQFADLYYQGGDTFGTTGNGTSYQLGTGVSTLSTYINFNDGSTSQTGNPLDMSIDGQGYFITKDAKSGTITYTRAGQFQFDKDGILVSRSTGHQVLGFAADGSLSTISLSGLRLNPPVATTTVKFTGNLSSTATDFSVGSISVIDAVGAQHVVSVDFKPKAGASGTWTVTLVDGTTETPAGELTFVGGSPDTGANTLSVTYSPTGTAPLNLKLDFSNQVTSFASGTSSTLAASSTDGTAAGNLTQETFDSQGVLTLTYSNGKTATGSQLALASFDSNTSLQATGSSEFVSADPSQAHTARAASNGLGKIVSNQVEISNVDLSSEFANLIVMQRGYQASSQLLTTADQMLQELFSMKGSR